MNKYKIHCFSSEVDLYNIKEHSPECTISFGINKDKLFDDAILNLEWFMFCIDNESSYQYLRPSLPFLYRICFYFKIFAQCEDKWAEDYIVRGFSQMISGSDAKSFLQEKCRDLFSDLNESIWEKWFYNYFGKFNDFYSKAFVALSARLKEDSNYWFHVNYNLKNNHRYDVFISLILESYPKLSFLFKGNDIDFTFYCPNEVIVQNTNSLNSIAVVYDYYPLDKLKKILTALTSELTLVSFYYEDEIHSIIRIQHSIKNGQGNSRFYSVLEVLNILASVDRIGTYRYLFPPNDVKKITNT